jgi:hypothetical protein
VGLVLNVHTGLTSPQFHIKLDTAFDTIPQVYKDETKHTSLWQLKAGYLTSEKTSRATKSKERVNKAQQPETVTPPTTQQVQNISFSPEGDTVPIQKATETQGDSLSGVPQDESLLGAQSRASGKISHESDTRAQEQAHSQSFQQQGPFRRSRRSRNPSKRLIEIMMAEVINQEIEGELFSFQAMFSKDDSLTQDNELLAYKAKADPDTMYLHQALKEPDQEKFIKAMEKEIAQQVQRGMYSIIKRSKVPPGATILPAVWALRRKRDVRTGAIKKYKARCNIDGSRMIPVEHYDLTYAPVAGWTSV